MFVEKGGVAKTTSAGHMAVAASKFHDLDVVLIDLATGQKDLMAQFGLKDVVTWTNQDDDAKDAPGDPDVELAPVSAVFGDDWEFIRSNIDNIVDRMTVATGEGPDLIPGDPNLGSVDNQLASVALEDRYVVLDQFVSDDLAEHYDLVLFDLPGADSNVALNGVFAASNIVAPLSPGKFEREQLSKLERDLELIAQNNPVDPWLALVFATRLDRRQTLDVEFAEDLADAYETASSEYVTKSAQVGYAQGDGMTLYGLDEDVLTNTGREARESYRALTDTLLRRITA